MILITFLEWWVIYLTYVHPTLMGVKLCCSSNPDPVQVTNITLSIMLGWLLQVADAVFCSYFIALRALYLIIRIAVALYFAHSTFLGASKVYDKCFAKLVEMYLPCVDTIVLHYIDMFVQLGPTQACMEFAMLFLRNLAKLMSIAKQLVSGMAATDIAPATLPDQHHHLSRQQSSKMSTDKNTRNYQHSNFTKKETNIGAIDKTTFCNQAVDSQSSASCESSAIPEEIDTTLSPSEDWHAL